MKNIPVYINLKRYDYGSHDASCHWNTWTDDVSLVNKQLFRNSRRNPNLFRLKLCS